MTHVQKRDSPKKPKTNTASTSDPISPEKKHTKSTFSRCCPWWNPDPVFDEELAQIVGERKRKKSVDTQRRQDTYVSKKDGCVETGHFVRRQTRGTKTMEGLRRSCKVTKNLPNPRAAVEISNSKTPKRLKVKPKSVTVEESNVSEINKMLRNRLTGTLSLDPQDPNEEGEALLSYHSLGSDIQPVILSQLVQGSDTRRMSVSSSDSERTRRRSSFALRNVDLAVEQSVYDSVYSKLQTKLKDTNDAEFINTLPKISKMLKNELESNLTHTQRYIKNLKTLFKNTTVMDQAKNKRTTERWMAILYTTSEERINSLTDFNCNLVRLILQHHCVAYEERDTALKKQPFKSQLKKVTGTDDIRVPFVCAKGISVGGVQVIFAMHKMKVIDYIFADFIMPPSVYVDWLYRRTKQKSALSLNVKLSGYPALNQMLSTKYQANIIRADRQLVITGKVTIKKARETWNSIVQEQYTQPSLLMFVLLKNTMFLAYSILNSIYSEYLPGICIQLDRKYRQENPEPENAEVQALIFENSLVGDAVIYTDESVVRHVRSSWAFTTRARGRIVMEDSDAFVETTSSLTKEVMAKEKENLQRDVVNLVVDDEGTPV